MKQINMAYF